MRTESSARELQPENGTENSGPADHSHTLF